MGALLETRYILGKDEQEQIKDKGAKEEKVLFAKHKLNVNMGINTFVFNLILILFSFKSHCVYGVCKYMQQKSDHLFLGSPVLKPGEGQHRKHFQDAEAFRIWIPFWRPIMPMLLKTSLHCHR